MRQRLTRGAWPLADITVLVVDPDPFEQRRIAVAIARAGGRVRTAADPDDALAIIPVEAIDAIVCGGDHAAPESAGWIVAARSATSRHLVTLALAPSIEGTTFDDHVDRSTPASGVAERLVILLGRGSTQRLKQID